MPLLTAARRYALSIFLLLVGVLVVPNDLRGQAETIRGRVTADSGRAVAGADVSVTRAPDRLILTARTDSLGHFTVRFDQGTGDYLVGITALGYKQFRRRLTRAGNDTTLLIDAVLIPQALDVAPVVASAQRQRPAREGGMTTDAAANERISDGVVGALGPDQAGDLAAIAATIPGILPTANGASALGLPADQNSTLMNGMNFSGGSVPRDAKVRTRIATSAYDPSRGGFSGAQISVDLSEGSIFSARRGHVTLDAPQMQYGDRVAQQLGGEFTSFALSASADGEAIRDTWFYNVSVEARKRNADAPSLLNAHPDVLTLSGVAPDSAARLLSALGTLGLPAGVGIAPDSRIDNELTFLARVDKTPRGDRTFGFTTYLNIAEAGATAVSPVVTPSFGGENTRLIGMLQGVYSFYFGKNYLSDTRTSLTYNRTRRAPYLLAPAGRVSVSSVFDDDATSFASLGFGGDGSVETQNDAWTWETVSDLQLYTRASKHKVRVHARSILDGYQEDYAGNRLGTFNYHSLNDLFANRAASFSRLISAPDVDGRMWSGVLAVGDNWRKSQKLGLMYGARLEANRYLDTPKENAAVATTFGVHTSSVPNRVHVSPRFGFSWMYGGANQNRFGMMVGPLATKYFSPTGIIRGGFGEFRGPLQSRLLSTALRTTGLPGDIVRLQCIGDAVPTAAWSSYLQNPGLIPEQCADGAPPAFSDAAPAVHLFADDYDASRSWRGNLGWSANIRKVGVSVDAIYSLNLNQPSIVDLNFDGQTRTSIPDENGRPVFVSAGSIVSETGAVSPVDARRSADFGRVMEQRSDLRSHSRQIGVTLTPDIGFGRYIFNLGYTLSSTRAQFRGFDGGAFGDPREIEWAASNFDARHQFLAQAGMMIKGFSVTLMHRVTSGLPFTPLVASDVNGDGAGGDRAFIFDPATTADEQLRAGMNDLLRVAPSWARDCLDRQLGKEAERNGCRGPWTQNMNLRVGISDKLLPAGERVSLALNFSNPLAGVDRLLHGNDLRGWGSTNAPDPVLYTVRGFDQQRNAFRYDVNQRFGDTRPARTAVRNPFRITLDVSINLGRDISLQQLDRFLRPGRTQPGEKLSVDSLQKKYARNVPDIYDMILNESDSLLISAEQTKALKEAQADYRKRMEAIWAALAAEFAALPDRFNTAEAVKRQEAAVDEGWETSRLESAKIKSILSPLQVQLLGGTARYVIDAKEKLRIRYFMN